MSIGAGIIVTPVSIDDVRSVLGASSYDLGTLCKSDNINLCSIKKPTNNGEPFNMTDWYKYDDSSLTSDRYGIKKPTFWLSTEVYNPASQHIALLTTSQKSYFSSNFGWGRCDWSRVIPTSYYRLTDFIGYKHTIEYSRTGKSNTPFYITYANPYRIGDNLSSEVAMYYQEDDEIFASDYGGLGFNSIFARKTYPDSTYPMYFGFVIFPYNSGSKDRPVMICSCKLGNSGSGTNYHFEADTGFIRIGASYAAFNDDSTDTASYFTDKESVYVVPFIAIGYNSGIQYFSLAAPWTTGYLNKDLVVYGGSASTENIVNPYLAYFKPTVYRRDTNEYWVYFASASDFTIQVRTGETLLGKLEIVGTGDNPYTHIGMFSKGTVYVYDSQTWYKFKKTAAATLTLSDTNWVSGNPKNAPLSIVTTSDSSFTIQVRITFLNTNKTAQTRTASVTFNTSLVSVGNTYTFSTSSALSI